MPSPVMGIRIGSKCATSRVTHSSIFSGMPGLMAKFMWHASSPPTSPSLGVTDSSACLESDLVLTLNGILTRPVLVSTISLLIVLSNVCRPKSMDVVFSSYLMRCASAVNSTSYAGPPSTSHTATARTFECAWAKYEISTRSSSPGWR